MTPEVQQAGYPYSLKIETATGVSIDLRIAFLTRKQVEDFLQSDFKRLVQETGIEGARVQMEQATTVDYEKALREIAACLRSAAVKIA